MFIWFYFSLCFERLHRIGGNVAKPGIKMAQLLPKQKKAIVVKQLTHRRTVAPQLRVLHTEL